jgi:hypothetical protein
MAWQGKLASVVVVVAKSPCLLHLPAPCLLLQVWQLKYGPEGAWASSKDAGHDQNCNQRDDSRVCEQDY